MNGVAVALIHHEASGFGVSFPDFPGAVTVGRDLEEAIRKGGEVLAFHIAGMAEDGESLPVLRSMAELQADPEFTEAAEGAIVALVPFCAGPEESQGPGGAKPPPS